MIKDDQYIYQPKGSMCANCEKQHQDCSQLDFESMKVFTEVEPIRIVICSEFKRYAD